MITHLSDLEQLYLGNALLSDKTSVLTLYVSLVEFFPPDFIFVEFVLFDGFTLATIERDLVQSNVSIKVGGKAEKIVLIKLFIL